MSKGSKENLLQGCSVQSDTYHVCAVGRVLWVGAAII